MSINLQISAIDVENPLNGAIYSGDDYKLLLADTQGNILKGHGRNASTHVFLRFDSSKVVEARNWISKWLSPFVTNAMKQLHESRAYKSTQHEVKGDTFINFGLTAAGYAALEFKDTEIPDDPSFRRGMHTAPTSGLPLNDPPVEHWELPYQNQSHALVIIADCDEARVNLFFNKMTTSLAETGISIVHQEPGHVFRNDKGQVIEHFGYRDGISQPLFFLYDIERTRDVSGVEQYDPSAPLGLVLIKDPLGAKYGYGSYFVFRKLRQDVALFRHQEEQLSKKLQIPEDLVGALAVGRFRDGTPVVTQSQPGYKIDPLTYRDGRPHKGMHDPNNFNYDNDADGLKCPFHAHIRKTNPRGDKVREFGFPLSEDRQRRIVRRGVSYGTLSLDPSPDENVGLLFMCAQSSIVDQFEFMQAAWCNFEVFLRANTGIDPIAGQINNMEGAPPVVEQSWQTKWGVRTSLNPLGEPTSQRAHFTSAVSLQGGDYFFLPSVSFLTSL